MDQTSCFAFKQNPEELVGLQIDSTWLMTFRRETKAMPRSLITTDSFHFQLAFLLFFFLCISCWNSLSVFDARIKVCVLEARAGHRSLVSGFSVNMQSQPCGLVCCWSTTVLFSCQQSALGKRQHRLTSQPSAHAVHRWTYLLYTQTCLSNSMSVSVRQWPQSEGKWLLQAIKQLSNILAGQKLSAFLLSNMLMLWACLTKKTSLMSCPSVSSRARELSIKE